MVCKKEVNLVEIQKVFACAKASKKKNVFIIERRVKNIFFSRSPKGNFLLGLLFNRNLVNSPTLGFENIEITSFQDGFLQIRNTKQRCSFLVIENTEESTIERFLDLVVQIIQETKRNQRVFKSPQELIQYIETWAQLFKNEVSKKSEEILGLYGELYFISKSTNPLRTFSMWKSPSRSRFDFTVGKTYLDIKTSTVGSIHHFDLEQVKREDGMQKYICSILCKASDKDGTNISDIIKLLKKYINKETLYSAILKRGPVGWHRFQKRYFVEGVNVFSADDIPQPQILTDSISDVKFKVSLSGITPNKRIRNIYTIF